MVCALVLIKCYVAKVPVTAESVQFNILNFVNSDFVEQLSFTRKKDLKHHMNL